MKKTGFLIKLLTTTCCMATMITSTPVVSFANVSTIPIELNVSDYEKVEMSSEIVGITAVCNKSNVTTTDTMSKNDFSVKFQREITYSDKTKETVTDSTAATVDTYALDTTVVNVGENIYTLTENVSGKNYSATVKVTATEPVVKESEKSGIYIASHPGKQMTSTSLKTSDVVVYWIYKDTYSDGHVVYRNSKDKVSDISFNKKSLSRGDNTITVTENESGNKYSDSFTVFGNYLDEKVGDGIIVRYAYEQIYTTSELSKSYCTVYFTYTYKYADGTTYEKQPSTTKCTDFSFSKTKVDEGDNTITVTENVTGHGYSGTFNIKGVKKQTTAPTSASTSTTKNPTSTSTPSTPTTTATSTSTTKNPTSTTNVNKPSATTTKSSTKDVPEEPKDAPTAEKILKITQTVDGSTKSVSYINDIAPANDDLGTFKDVPAVLSKLLDDEDYAILDNDGSVTVELNITDELIISDQDKEELSSRLGENEYIGKIFDLSLNKLRNGEIAVVYTELDSGIEITLQIPEICKGDDRTYRVMRIHNTDKGEKIVDILDDKDDNPDTITIITDKFSLYAITYTNDVLELFDVTDAAPECEHNWMYTPNGEGTHLMTCSICNESKIEECSFPANADGSEGTICQHCGWEKEVETPDKNKKLISLLLLLLLLLLIGGGFAIWFFFFKKKNDDDDDDDDEDEEYDDASLDDGSITDILADNPLPSSDAFGVPMPSSAVTPESPTTDFSQGFAGVDISAPSGNNYWDDEESGSGISENTNYSGENEF